jgi:hypothetical protein
MSPIPMNGAGKAKIGPDSKSDAIRLGAKDKLILFDDVEMSEWLLKLTDNSSGQFLHALSEAVLKASDEEYAIIRPALMDLKRRHSEFRRKLEIASSLSARGNGIR